MNRYIQLAKESLESVSSSARLDAELLLCKVMNQPKTFLYSHSEYELTAEEKELFSKLLQQRQQGKPMAYILGKQEFWDLELDIKEGVLIPRPETECLVEKILELLPTDKPQLVADLGTGSGALALALAKECPQWLVYATDISMQALKQAEANAQKYNLTNINFARGAWCAALPKQQFDCIASNPPYIAEDDPDLETFVAKYEPRAALIAAKNGLEAIEKIAQAAPGYLKPNAYLILEHGYQQAKAVELILQKEGYNEIMSCKDYSGKARFIVARIET